MKKRLFFISFLLLFMVNCGKSTTRDISEKHIFSLLPEQTSFLMMGKSIEDGCKVLGVEKNKVLGKLVKENYIKAIIRRIGVNILDKQELQNVGIDLEKEIGMGISNFSLQELGQPKLNFFMFIPVLDRKKAFGMITNIIKKFPDVKSRIQQQGEDYLTLKEENKSLEVYFKENYLFINFVNGAQVQSLSALMKEGSKSLLENKNFQNVMRKVKSGDDFFMYGTVSEFANEVLKHLGNFSYGVMPGYSEFVKLLKQYKSVGVSAHLQSADLVVDTVVEMNEGSTLLEIMNNKNLDRKGLENISAPPAVLISSFIEPFKYFQLLTRMFEDQDVMSLDQNLERFKSETGVDLKEDILKNFQGTFHLGVFDGASINMLNYNGLLAARIKDEAKARKVLETLLAKAGPQAAQFIQRQKDGAYVFNLVSKGLGQFFLNIKDNLIFFTQSRDYYNSLMQGQKGALFSFLPDERVKKVLESNQHVFYVNVDQVYAAVKNFSGLINMANQTPVITTKTDQVVSLFEYFLANSQIKENWVEGSFVIKTRFKKPFLLGVSDLFPGASW